MAQARELIDRVTAAVFAQDYEALRDCYAPDCVITAPDLGTVHGVEQLITWMREFGETLPDMTYQLDRKLDGEGFAADQGDVIGTNTGPIHLPDGTTLPATGKEVRIRTVDIATVENGKISRHDFYFDQLEFLTQLGLMEAPVTTG